MSGTLKIANPLIVRGLAVNSNKLDGVSLEKGKLLLARLEKDVPEEAMNKAQAILVNFHHTCRGKPTLRNWKRSYYLSI